jgi:MFS family permease
MSAARPRLFVWTLSIAQLVSWGSLYYAFSVFIEPMTAALGWNKTELTGALSLGLLMSAVAALPVGILIDRGHARAVMTGGSIAGAALLALWSLNSSLPLFYAIYVGLGVVLAMTLYDPAFAVLNAALGLRARRAIMAMTLVAGLASTAFFPLSQFLIDRFGWRSALLWLAAINIVIPAAVHFIMLRGIRATPIAVAAPDREAAAARQSSPLRIAMRTRVFWSLLVSQTCSNAVFAVTSFHLIPLLIERGFAVAGAVAAASLIGPMQVAGRIVVMAAGRHATAQRTGRAALLLSLAGAALISSLQPGSWLVGVFVLLYGAGNGIMSILRGTAVQELIGTEGFGAITGAIAAAANVARALAPVAAAAIWSIGGDYDSVIVMLIAFSVVGLAAFWLAGTPRTGRA